MTKQSCSSAKARATMPTLRWIGIGLFVVILLLTVERFVLRLEERWRKDPLTVRVVSRIPGTDFYLRRPGRGLLGPISDKGGSDWSKALVPYAFFASFEGNAFVLVTSVERMEQADWRAMESEFRGFSAVDLVDRLSRDHDPEILASAGDDVHRAWRIEVSEKRGLLLISSGFAALPKSESMLDLLVTTAPTSHVVLPPLQLDQRAKFTRPDQSP